MRGFAWALTLIAPLAAACMHHPEEPVAEPGPSAIMLERGPCFGACPVYAVTIKPDGAGMFAGRRFVAIADEREFKMDPETFERVATLLAAWEPQGEERRIGAEGCAMYATDHPSWTIRWTGHGGDVHTLHFDTGCHDQQYKGLAEAIRASRGLLPIDRFVGRRDG